MERVLRLLTEHPLHSRILSRNCLVGLWPATPIALAPSSKTPRLDFYILKPPKQRTPIPEPHKGPKTHEPVQNCQGWRQPGLAKRCFVGLLCSGFCWLEGLEVIGSSGFSCAELLRLQASGRSPCALASASPPFSVQGLPKVARRPCAQAGIVLPLRQLFRATQPRTLVEGMWLGTEAKLISCRQITYMHACLPTYTYVHAYIYHMYKRTYVHTCALQTCMQACAYVN